MQKVGGHGLPLFSYSYLKLTICLILLKKHDANDLADLSQYTRCVSYMNFVMGLAHYSVSVAQWLSIRAQNPKFLLRGDLEFFLRPTLVTRHENISLHFSTKLKTYHLPYSIY